MRSQRKSIEMTQKMQQLQQYVKFHDSLLNQAYNKILPELTALTEGIITDISANYDGGRTDLYELAGTLNGRVLSIYQTLGTLLTKTNQTIQRLNSEISTLRAQIESENDS